MDREAFLKSTEVNDLAKFIKPLIEFPYILFRQNFQQQDGELDDLVDYLAFPERFSYPHDITVEKRLATGFRAYKLFLTVPARLTGENAERAQIGVDRLGEFYEQLGFLEPKIKRVTAPTEIPIGRHQEMAMAV